jgi:hypothetical protein
MDSQSSSITGFARRARAIGVGLAIAGLSAGFVACSDDEADEALNDAEQQIDEAQEDLQSVGEEAGGEVEEGVNEAQDKIDSVQDDADK